MKQNGLALKRVKIILTSCSYPVRCVLVVSERKLVKKYYSLGLNSDWEGAFCQDGISVVLTFFTYAHLLLFET